MKDDEKELIHSPLSQTHRAGGHTVSIQIYRVPGEAWVLEIVDGLGTSTVWDGTFDTDTAALATALAAIEEDGMDSFLAEAQRAAAAAQPEWLRKLAKAKNALPGSDPPDAMTPLSEEELDALDHFLLYTEEDETMTLETLDGYLHAIAIGPETLMPSQWLPKVWGQEAGAMMPPAQDLDEVNLILSWVMRHFNSIVSGFEQSPPALAPLWGTTEFGAEGAFEDAEAWAFGFAEGVKLNPAAWQPLFNDAKAQLWYRPIGLLGADAFSPDQDALTRTPEQRQVLSLQIEASLAQIHAFWLPLRQAVQERDTAKHLVAKVGRNEPCPCGSGKKFKKCCGAASILH